MYVSNSLRYSRRYDFKFSTDKRESVWLEFDQCFLPNRQTVGSIYRSPASSYSGFCNELENILKCLTYQNKNIIITGGVNTNLIDLTDNSCSEYINCILGHGLQSLINLPTRSSGHDVGTVIDHILSNVSFSQSAGVIDFDITHHCAFLCYLKARRKIREKCFTSDLLIKVNVSINQLCRLE